MKSQEPVWDKLYNKNNNLWNRETSNMPDILKNKEVLEVGAGNGKTLHTIIKQKPKSITAIDISREAINILKSLFKEKNIKFINESIIRTTLKKERFDIIVCYYVLNNLREYERTRAVEEMHRLLKDKGTILFEDFAVNDFRQKEGKSLNSEENTIIKNNGLIHHFFTKEELNNLFRRFKSIDLKKKSFSPFRNKKHIQRRLISAIINK